MFYYFEISKDSIDSTRKNVGLWKGKRHILLRAWNCHPLPLKNGLPCSPFCSVNWMYLRQTGLMNTPWMWCKGSVYWHVLMERVGEQSTLAHREFPCLEYLQWLCHPSTALPLQKQDKSSKGEVLGKIIYHLVKVQLM